MYLLKCIQFLCQNMPTGISWIKENLRKHFTAAKLLDAYPRLKQEINYTTFRFRIRRARKRKQISRRRMFVEMIRNRSK